MSTAGADGSAAIARVEMDVRWGDLDAFGHVNNAAFLVYAQEARVHWLGSLGTQLRDDTCMPVVAAVNCNFRRQLGWPARIMVELSIHRIGNSSMTIGHRIADAKDGTCIYADGETVMVWIDPRSGHSIALPAAVRSMIQSASPVAGATTSK